MIKVVKEIYDVEDLMHICWGDALEVLAEIQRQNREEEAMSFLDDGMDDAYARTMTDTGVNDFVRFTLPDLMGLYVVDVQEDE